MQKRKKERKKKKKERQIEIKTVKEREQRKQEKKRQSDKEGLWFLRFKDEGKDKTRIVKIWIIRFQPRRTCKLTIEVEVRQGGTCNSVQGNVVEVSKWWGCKRMTVETLE